MQYLFEYLFSSGINPIYAPISISRLNVQMNRRADRSRFFLVESGERTRARGREGAS